MTKRKINISQFVGRSSQNSTVILLLLLLLAIFTHHSHLESIQEPAEHFQCSLCQSNTEPPNVSLTPFAVTQLLSFEKISQQVFGLFFVSQHLSPPLRAPPVF